MTEPLSGNNNPCRCLNVVEINGRFFCESCGLEFEPPSPLCSCYIIEKGGVHICIKCGIVYKEDYLRKAISGKVQRAYSAFSS